MKKQKGTGKKVEDAKTAGSEAERKQFPHRLQSDHTRALLVIFLCMLCFALPIFGILFYRNVQTEKAAYQARIQAAVSRIADAAGSNLSSTLDAGNTIFGQRWYAHYRNTADIYVADFNPLYREDISSNLRSITASRPFLVDLAVITPAKDSVISSKGWFSLEDYERFYHYLHVDDPGDGTREPTVRALNSEHCLLTLKDYSARRDKSVVGLLIDRKKFADQFLPLVTEEITAVSLRYSGEEFFSWGEAGADDGAFSRIAAGGMEIRLAAKSFESQYAGALLRSVCVHLFLVLAASYGIARLCVWINFAPLRRLVTRLTGQKQPPAKPYEVISRYISEYETNNSHLQWENISLQKSIDLFLNKKKNEIMLGMLLRSDFDWQDPFVNTLLPWVEEHKPFWMAVLEPVAGGRTPDIGLPREEGEENCHQTTLRLFNDGVCILLWFEKREWAAQQLPAIQARLQEWADAEEPPCLTAFSSLLEDTSQIYGTFQALHAALRQEDASLPASRPDAFLTSLWSGDLPACRSILASAQSGQAEPDIFEWLLETLSSGNHKPGRKNHPEKNDPQARWQRIEAMTEELCGALSQNQEDSDYLAGLICRFIQESYCDPNMSIALLADQFSIHRSTISRMIKNHTGLTFSEYLLDLRMKQASSLLQSTDQSLASVSASIGYENYSSFKRAFMRYQGVTPAEYRSARLTAQ